MGTSKTRERNQMWMYYKFKEAYKTGRVMISKDKLLSQFCLEMHASMRYAKEMLKVFEMAKMIRVHKDRIEVLR